MTCPRCRQSIPSGYYRCPRCGLLIRAIFDTATRSGPPSSAVGARSFDLSIRNDILGSVGGF
jgi:hypothetical protein